MHNPGGGRHGAAAAAPGRTGAGGLRRSGPRPGQRHPAEPGGARGV